MKDLKQRVEFDLTAALSNLNMTDRANLVIGDRGNTLIVFLSYNHGHRLITIQKEH